MEADVKAAATNNGSLLIDWSNLKPVQLDSENLEVKVGPLRIWLRCLNSEIWLAHKSGLDQDKALTDEQVKNFQKWSRWALDRSNPQVEFKPVLSDRAVVVRPDYEFLLPPDNTAKIFVRIPIRLEVHVSQPEIKLAEIDSIRMSNTWFGSFTDGELCYWISATARRSAFVDPEARHLCICPIVIINKANENLLVQRIKLPTDGLAIYEQAGQLWSSETSITYKGPNQVSDMNVYPGRPQAAPQARFLSSARVTGKQGLSLRTFGKLFHFN